MRTLKVAFDILLLDQVLKYFIVHTPRLHNMALLPSLNLHLAYNSGAAFGMLATAGGWQRYVFIVLGVAISAVILFWSAHLGKKDKWEGIALGLILGGAIGNLIDRIRIGAVIDYIDFYIGSWHWYTFNLADIAICVGAVLLALISLQKK